MCIYSSVEALAFTEFIFCHMPIGVPVVTVPINSISTVAGSNIMLECGASGDPAPSVVWFYNSVQVPNSATPHITQSASNSLIFSPAQFSDRGQYVCQATNAAGQDSDSLQLVVSGK